MSTATDELEKFAKEIYDDKDGVLEISVRAPENYFDVNEKSDENAKGILENMSKIEAYTKSKIPVVYNGTLHAEISYKSKFGRSVVTYGDSYSINMAMNKIANAIARE